jgi:hypothetical protein
MILKLFLGTVGQELLEGLGENKVDKDDKDTDVSDTSFVDVVAAHPVPEYPSVDISNIPSVANSQLPRLIFRCGSIDSSFLSTRMVGVRFFRNPKQSTCQFFFAEKAVKTAEVQIH